MTFVKKAVPLDERFEETICDKCGEDFLSDHDLSPHHAVLEPHFGYDSGFDMIQDGPNRMCLYFCEKCYKSVLTFLGLEIGCSQYGYCWKETGDIWPHLDKGDIG